MAIKWSRLRDESRSFPQLICWVDLGTCATSFEKLNWLKSLTFRFHFFPSPHCTTRPRLGLHFQLDSLPNKNVTLSNRNRLQLYLAKPKLYRNGLDNWLTWSAIPLVLHRRYHLVYILMWEESLQSEVIRFVRGTMRRQRFRQEGRCLPSGWEV